MCKASLFLCAPALAMIATPAAAQLRGDVHAGLDSLSSDGESQEGVTYGLTVSYDLPGRDMILGVQLDLDATDNRDCKADVFVTGDRACIEGQRDTAITGRLGYRAGDRVMLIGTAGYANARFRASYEGAGIRTDEHETLDGVRLGVAAVADIGRRLYAKAEYRYTNYEQDVSRHQGLAGIGLRF